MVLFGIEPVVLFRNETGCRRFRRNAWQGDGEGGGEEGRGGDWTVGEEGGSGSIQSRKKSLVPGP